MTVEAMDNAVTDHSMEFAPFIPLRKALSVLRLASAILPEILSSLGYGVGEQFHFDPSKRFA